MYRQTDGQTDGVQQLMRPLDRVALTITFQYRVNERFVRFVTDRQTDITKKQSISLVKYIRRYVMPLLILILSWIDVN